MSSITDRTAPGGVRSLPDSSVFDEGHDDRVCHLLDDDGHPYCGLPRSRLTGSPHPTSADPTSRTAECGLPRCMRCVDAWLS